MLSKVLEFITRKDDLERVAYREDSLLLAKYLKTRTLLIPQRPRRFLDAANFTMEELKTMTEAECTRLGGSSFEPWIFDMKGKKRLPAFSSHKAMNTFSSKLSMDLNKVFGLGCVELLLADVATMDVDIVDLNLYSKKSWEITIRQG